MAAYDQLASVYDWLTPDELLDPAGAVAAYEAVVSALPKGARVLDCACGPGRLAVGLAAGGYEVVASDASPAMVARTRALATEHGVAVDASVCTWENLHTRGDGRFDAVLCVGNSLPHAEGRPGRRAALAEMAAVLAPDGVVAISSRNWERLRRQRPTLEVADRVVTRGGRRGVVVHAWTLPHAWGAAHGLEITVALLGDDDMVERFGERLAFWPFRPGELNDDLRAVGLAPGVSTYAPDCDRYLVTARRRP